MASARPGLRRCAIYTRKSSTEGLEQQFNSLGAQREACEAYVRSQRGEGWRIIQTPYDDGGLSGATMARPALERLLADIAHDLIEVVVVYKVDRLSPPKAASWRRYASARRRRLRLSPGGGALR